MRQITLHDLQKTLAQRKADQRLNFQQCDFSGQKLDGLDLSNCDFSQSLFPNASLKNVNVSHSSLQNARLDGCSLRGSNLTDADLRSMSCRGSDLSNCDCRGANFYHSVLERANLKGIKTDEKTKWFRMYCPAKGPLVGFKKCFNDRIVQLLIPADAKRCSATEPACRCNKAKVLKISNFDETEQYDEAWSLADPNFVYRRGQWVTVKNFKDDRWYESTTGIHFWLTRDEAIAY